MQSVDPVIYDRVSFLERRYPIRRMRVRGAIGAIPLADVVLILLMFFIMNSWHILKPAVSIDLPVAPFVSGVAQGARVVTVSSENLIFYDDERTTLEGLRSGFVRAVQDDSGVTLVIQADQRVSHGMVVKIYTIAMEAGIREIALATRLPSPPRDVPDTP